MCSDLDLFFAHNFDVVVLFAVAADRVVILQGEAEGIDLFVVGISVYSDRLKQDFRVLIGKPMYQNLKKLSGIVLA